MKIRVADIHDKVKSLDSQEEVSSFPTLLQAQDAGECRFISPVDVSLSVRREYDHIRVNGTVGTKVSLSCSRCLSDFTTDLFSEFTLFYTKTQQIQPEDEVELDEQTLVSVTYTGDEIDFSDEIAEQVLLELPYKPLCSEDCKGLCSSCGADFNATDCDCSAGKASMAFSSLKGLKLKQ